MKKFTSLVLTLAMLLAQLPAYSQNPSAFVEQEFARIVRMDNTARVYLSNLFESSVTSFESSASIVNYSQGHMLHANANTAWGKRVGIEEFSKIKNTTSRIAFAEKMPLNYSNYLKEEVKAFEAAFSKLSVAQKQALNSYRVELAARAEEAVYLYQQWPRFLNNLDQRMQLDYSIKFQQKKVGTITYDVDYKRILQKEIPVMQKELAALNAKGGEIFASVVSPGTQIYTAARLIPAGIADDQILTQIRTSLKAIETSMKRFNTVIAAENAGSEAYLLLTNARNFTKASERLVKEANTRINSNSELLKKATSASQRSSLEAKIALDRAKISEVMAGSKAEYEVLLRFFRDNKALNAMFENMISKNAVSAQQMKSFLELCKKTAAGRGGASGLSRGGKGNILAITVGSFVLIGTTVLLSSSDAFSSKAAQEYVDISTNAQRDALSREAQMLADYNANPALYAYYSFAGGNKAQQQKLYSMMSRQDGAVIPAREALVKIKELEEGLKGLTPEAAAVYLKQVRADAARAEAQEYKKGRAELQPSQEERQRVADSVGGAELFAYYQEI
ncbi:hypothetical protein Dip510_001016 [Elusimicrobium posterum]|uniref:hypothetical protein n=1 Tax=Elusimicrobium posterum TaxID=3116653 RepID=UPI003C71F243